LLVDNCIGSPSTILLKRACFDIAGCFDESLSNFEDYDLWIRIAKYFQFYCIPSPLYSYYIHNIKLTNNPVSLDHGLSVMLKRYGSNSIKSKKFYSRYYLKLGILYCFDKNLKNGWKSYLKAIRLYPFEIRNYYNLLISFFGPRLFRFLKEVKPKFSERLKLNKI
jgi:Glycosyltransferase like family 2